MRDSVDKALDDLFNLAALNPLGVKGIYLPAGKGVVDCRSINTTVNNDGSRMPFERTMEAVDILKRCYKKLDQMEAMFFIYYYGAEDSQLMQIVRGVSILADIDELVADHGVKGYRDGMQDLAELAKRLEIGYKQADYQSGKARKQCAILHQSIHSSVENILMDEKLIDTF